MVEIQGTIKDIEKSEFYYHCRGKPCESHPVLATRIKRSHKLYGQKLIVADLRKHELAERADLYLHPKPSTDLVWLSAITKYILDQGWEDKEFLQNRVKDVEAYKQVIGKIHIGICRRNYRFNKRRINSNSRNDS